MNPLNDPNVCAALALLSLGIIVATTAWLAQVNQRIKDVKSMLEIKETTL